MSISLDSSVCVSYGPSWTLKFVACLGCRNAEQKSTLSFLEGASRVMLTIQLNLILKVSLFLNTKVTSMPSRWYIFRLRGSQRSGFTTASRNWHYRNPYSGGTWYFVIKRWQQWNRTLYIHFLYWKLEIFAGVGVLLCIEKALANAGVSRHEVNYVNAHATSTEVGDHQEYKALLRSFGEKPEVSWSNHGLRFLCCSCSVCWAMLRYNSIAPHMNCEWVLIVTCPM